MEIKIKIKTDDKTFELTLDEALELRNKLNRMIVDEQKENTKPYKPISEMFLKNSDDENRKIFGE